MRVLPLVAAIAFLASLVAPAATAYSQPVFYFLKSGCPVDEVNGECHVPEVDVPPAPPLPPPAPPVPAVGQPKLVLVDGILDPYDFKRMNAPNSTEPDLKLVYTASETVQPVRFLTPENHSHPNRIKGSFLVGLWTGESPVPNGNLTVHLYEVKADGTEVAIANASIAIDLNASKAPDPATLVPPNSTDPMAIVLYEVGQVSPLVLVPPLVLLLGPVDITVENGSRFAMGFQLDAGSSPAPEPPGAVTLRYNATFMPSFVYVPWYAPDPPRSTSTRTSTYSSTRLTGPRGTFSNSGTGDDDDGKKGGNGIPGLELGVVLGLVAVAAIVARRRL